MRTPIGYIPCIRILVTAILFAYPLDCLVRLVARYLMGYPSQLLISFATGRDDDLDSNWKICHSSTGIDPRITFTVLLVLPPAIADHIDDRPGGHSCFEFFTYYDITNAFACSLATHFPSHCRLQNLPINIAATHQSGEAASSLLHGISSNVL